MNRLILIIASALFMLGCEGPAGRDGRDGDDAWIWSREYNVYANHWEARYRDEINMTNKFYIVTLKIPALTQNVCDYGSVSVYYRFGDGVQTPLPWTFPQELIENGKHFYFTEVIGYEFKPGYIDLILTESDFPARYYPFYDMVFRVVLSI